MDLTRYRSYEEIIRGFRWEIPPRYNIAAAVDAHAQRRGRVALYYEDPEGKATAYTFDDLKRLSNRLANALTALGVRKGDRVALMLPQRPETGITHLALYKVGAVAVPISFLYGPQTLEHILGDCEATALVIAGEFLDKLAPVRDRLPALRHVLVVGGETAGHLDFQAILERGVEAFVLADTGAEDPTLLLYTSGTTGPPKGALHAQRILPGYLLTFSLFFNLRFDERTVFWTPSDWAWVGGLLDILLPAWALGHPVLGYAGRFDPDRAFGLMAKYRVTHTFLAPTALKMLAQVPHPKESYGSALRVIASGGESVASEILRWGEEELGVPVNEFYGLTEVNHLIGNCAALWEIVPGSMGLPYPGREVALTDDEGQPVPPGEEGEIVVRRGDPTCFLGYWGKPEKTREKMRGEWILTGDLAEKDERGYYFFKGRKDDLIISAGYRVGPAEVEDALLQLPEVAEAAVVGSPDPVRGEVVKAFIKLAAGVAGSAELVRRIQQHVRQNLAAYKYPREVEFVDDLPATTTGKLNRRLLRQQERERKGRVRETLEDAGSRP